MSKADKIPDGITQEHLLAAIADLNSGVPHRFGESTGYDVLHEGRRYPPKAVVGLAAGKILGEPLGPYDFRGGLGTKCFAVLENHGFTIVSKGDTNPFPDEVDERDIYTEGAIQKVAVNRYERDPKARDDCISHYGAQCQVCGFDFIRVYGAIGKGFIHVHHIVPLSEIGSQYVVDPIKDLRAVCPNCHAMLHKRRPPYSIEELQGIIENHR